MLKEINNPKRWNSMYDVIDWFEILLIVMAELMFLHSLYYVVLPLSVFIEYSDVVKYVRNKRSGAYKTKGVYGLDTLILIFQVMVMVCAVMRITSILSA